jgi:hypothetical protein
MVTIRKKCAAYLKAKLRVAAVVAAPYCERLMEQVVSHARDYLGLHGIGCRKLIRAAATEFFENHVELFDPRALEGAVEALLKH